MPHPAVKRRISTSSCVKGGYGLVCLIPAFLVLLMVSIGPAVLNVILSLTDYNGDFGNMSFVGLSNYRDFFGLFGADVWSAIVTTLYYMALTVLPSRKPTIDQA